MAVAKSVGPSLLRSQVLTKNAYCHAELGLLGLSVLLCGLPCLSQSELGADAPLFLTVCVLVEAKVGS